MSIAELAEATGLCQNTLYTLAQRGQLPGTLRFGKRWMFSRAAVSEALDRGWVPGDSAGASS
jgi:excisionase family DNA binding protein